MEELKIAAALVAPRDAASPQKPEGQGGAADFARMLGDVIRETSAAQQEAEHQARELAAGRGDTLEAVLAITQADLSLRFLLQVRNSALEAYHEILRMQV